MKREKIYTDNFARKSIYEDLVSWRKKHITRNVIGWALILAMLTASGAVLYSVKDFFD